MKGRGLFNLCFLFGFVFYSTKLIQARSNVLHDGVLDSMAYDPNLLSMLQMEQSLDLDDDESAYLGTSLLDKSPSFLQQGCSRRTASCSKPGSFLQQTSLSSSSSSSSVEPDFFVDEGSSFLEDDDDDSEDDESFLEEQEDDDDSDTDVEDSFLESKSTSTSSSSLSSSSYKGDDDDWGNWSSPSYLETGSSYKKAVGPSTFGSLIQLHNFETEPLNFLQDDTLLLMNEQNDDEEFENEENPKTTKVKAYVLKSDQLPEPDLDALDETTAQQLLSTVKAYKVWVVVGVVLLLIAVVVRLYYLDKFLKFKNELWTKLDNFNKTVVGKWNAVFKKNQTTDTQTEQTDDNTPLLSA